MRTARTEIDYDALVKDERVHGRVYTDPAIFEDEMDKIFSGVGSMWAMPARSPSREISA
jgi:hypothetical protein